MDMVVLLVTLVVAWFVTVVASRNGIRGLVPFLISKPSSRPSASESTAALAVAGSSTAPVSAPPESRAVAANSSFLCWLELTHRLRSLTSGGE